MSKIDWQSDRSAPKELRRNPEITGISGKRLSLMHLLHLAGEKGALKRMLEDLPDGPRNAVERYFAETE